MKSDHRWFHANRGNKIFWSLSLLIIAAVFYLYNISPRIFIRFFGNLNPLFVFLVCIISGHLSLRYLHDQFGFRIHEKRKIRSSLWYLRVALIFPVIAIMVDLIMVFPKDMNIEFPYAMLFYPTMAFLVEIFFHALPLCAVLFLTTFIFNITNIKDWVWLIITIVAAVEPTFQILADTYPWWAMIITWVNLFLFNVFQLFLFKKFGFVTMYCSRIIYYSIWHMIWGFVRLDVLF